MRFFCTLILFVCIPALLSSQTADQAKAFITRSQMALFKSQKELLKQSNRNYDAALKKSIKFQLMAVKLFKQNNFKDAVGFSFKSRSQSLEILNNVCKEAVANLGLNSDEKGYCNVSEYNKLEAKSGLLTPAETEKVESMDVTRIQQLNELELGIKSN
ncbi:MAG: hypothetical protein ACXVPQ_00835 [Bacteroidia bacterium]